MSSPLPKEKKHTLFHLRDCVAQLSEIIRELEGNPGYRRGSFEADITHAYHHLNYAWNSRRLGAKRVWSAREDDFYRLRQMPKDIDLKDPRPAVRLPAAMREK